LFACWKSHVAVRHLTRVLIICCFTFINSSIVGAFSWAYKHTQTETDKVMEARKERREQLEKDEEIRVENNGNKGSENTTEEKKEINKIDPVAKMVIRDAIITNNHNTTGGGGGGGLVG
ncbi:hypothetical protein O6P43_002793, partial [Quillaja saponaria]